MSEVSDDLAAGRLVRVLPEWSLPTLDIYAVWPESSHRSSLVKLLLEFLLDP
ncbi:LysR substrate-binding domain-containing protein [Haliea sp.]|uniref:LysR substrate-binding domain-containing protein n=1 Tax=Haliea sp. TaxID=1932666 RepID=UPI0032EE20AF